MSQDLPSYPDGVEQQQTIRDVSIINSQYVNIRQDITEQIYISVDKVRSQPFTATSPYRGLKPFDFQDKDLFFGRNQFLSTLVDELEQTNLILLLGASGSGKSSVVRAGLIPLLLKRFSSFVSLVFTPDRDPFESLYASLRQKYKQEEAEIARAIASKTFAQVVKTLKQPAAYWLILIDQFEELFTISQPEKRNQFIKSLLHLVKDLDRTNDRSVKIVATMRADFLDELSDYPEFVKATHKHRPVLAAMEVDELRLAIEQPAAQHGVVFETGLVQEIIEAVQGQAGYLPFLAYTLDLLWQQEQQRHTLQQERTLYSETYRELGGVRGALQQRMDHLYESLSESERLAVQHIFLTLVEIEGVAESGTEWKPVRKRVAIFEFQGKLKQKVLTQLINEKLLVSDRQSHSEASTVEFAHEILLTSWKKLKAWIEENRLTIALRSRLNDDVARWYTKKEEDEKTAKDELWTGSKLEQVLDLRKDETFNQVLGGFSATANQFIDASFSEREHQRITGERQRKRAILGLSGFSAVALLLAGIAGWQWQQSVRQNVLTLIESSDARLRSGQQLEAMITAIKAAKQAQQLGQTELLDRTLGTLQHVIYDGKPELNLLQVQQGNVWGVTFSPDGRQIVTRGDAIRLWDADTGKQTALLQQVNESNTDIVFSPDSRRIVIGGRDGIVRLWDADTGKQTALLQGHQGYVNAVVFSPDGKQIATGGGDATIRLWNVDTGEQMVLLQGHQGHVDNVIFSPDGKQIVTGGDDGSVKLWDADTGKQTTSLQGHQGSRNVVVFSPDGKQIAITAGGNGSVQLWSTSTGKQIAVLQGEQDYISDIAFSPDGKRIAICQGGTIQLWDVGTAKQTYRLQSQDGADSVAFSFDGKQIVTGGASVELWNANTGIRIAVLQSRQGEVVNFALSPNGKQIAISGRHNLVQLFDVTEDGQTILLNGEQDNTYQDHRNYINNVVFSSDSKQIATGRADGIIQLWDVATGKQTAVLQGHQDGINAVVFSSDGKQVATSRVATYRGDSKDDGMVRLLNTAPGEQTILLQGRYAPLQGGQYAFNDIVFSPDSKQIATGRDDGTIQFIQLWNVATGEPLARLQVNQVHIYGVVFSPNSQRLATRGGDDMIRLWDADTGEQMVYLQGLQDDVDTIIFSPDSKQIATSKNDGTVQLWDVATGQQTKLLQGHQGSVGVVFSPDGKQLATFGADETIRLWDVATGQQTKLLQGHQSSVGPVVFSPNGKQLATREKDSSAVRLWDISTGQQTALLQGYQGSANTVVFSPDGKQLAIGGGDGTVRLWQVGGIEELLVRGCSRIRNYLHNPTADLSEKDRHLCDGIGENQD